MEPAAAAALAGAGAAALTFGGIGLLSTFRKPVKEGFTGIEKLSELKATNGTICIGKTAGKRVYLPPETHLFVTGPTGSGKTKNSLLTPLFEEPKKSFIVFDYKGDITQETAAARSKWGPVYILNPGGETNRYNPYTDLRAGDFDGVTDLHNALIPAGAHEYFGAKSAQLIAGGARHVLATNEFQKSPLGVWKLFANDWQEAIANSPDEAARAAVRPFLQGDGDHSSSVEGTLSTYLGWVQYQGTKKLIQESEFSISELQCGKYPVTLYVRLPMSSRQEMLPFARMVFGILKVVLMTHEKVSRNGEAKNRECVLMVDEVGSLAPPGLGHLLSTIRSYGFTAMLASQTFSGVRKLYQDEIEGNCEVGVHFRPVLFDEAKHLREKIGTHTVWETKTEYRNGKKIVLRQAVKKPVMSEEEILKERKHEHAIGFVMGHPVYLDTVYAPSVFADWNAPYEVEKRPVLHNPWDGFELPREAPQAGERPQQRGRGRQGRQVPA